MELDGVRVSALLPLTAHVPLGKSLRSTDPGLICETGQTPHWVLWEVKAFKGRIPRSGFTAIVDNEAQRPEPQTANYPES